MARPSIPEAEKRRTVPFRMTKPDYRALTILMRVTDTTIQEHLRNALSKHVDEAINQLRGDVEFKIPSAYEIGSWSEEAFNNWLETIGKRNPQAQVKRPGGIRMTKVAA